MEREKARHGTLGRARHGQEGRRGTRRAGRRTYDESEGLGLVYGEVCVCVLCVA